MHCQMLQICYIIGNNPSQRYKKMFVVAVDLSELWSHNWVTVKWYIIRRLQQGILIFSKTVLPDRFVLTSEMMWQKITSCCKCSGLFVINLFIYLCFVKLAPQTVYDIWSQCVLAYLTCMFKISLGFGYCLVFVLEKSSLNMFPYHLYCHSFPSCTSIFIPVVAVIVIQIP
jgi:hypothetical protein